MIYQLAPGFTQEVPETTARSRLWQTCSSRAFLKGVQKTARATRVRGIVDKYWEIFDSLSYDGGR